VHNQQAHETTYHLQERFYKAKMDLDKSVASFLSKLEIIHSELVSISDDSIKDNNIMAKMLSNLLRVFRSFNHLRIVLMLLDRPC